VSDQLSLARKPKPTPLTENEMLARLCVKYNETAGNGSAYAFIPGVRSAAGFDSRRTIDAYMMSLWPSRGLTLTAFECKSSRSDWQRELKKPEKAEEFCALADYFYLVVGDKDIVRHGELPETWGLIVPHGKGMKVAVEAPRLRPAEGRPTPLPPGFGRSYLAALLRAATYVAAKTPQDIADAEQRGREAEAASLKRHRDDFEARYNALNAKVREFEQAAGIQLNTSEWSYGPPPAEVGAAVKTVLAGSKEIERMNTQLEHVRANAQRIADEATALLSPPVAERAA
jgi:hypothetical protein